MSAGEDNVVFEVFSDVKDNVFVGCSPLTASALPHAKPLCPRNEAILDTIQPFCTEKCIPLSFKIVKEMNQ